MGCSEARLIIWWPSTPNLTTEYIHYTFKTHTDAKNRDATSEMTDGIARYARVCDGVTWARGDDKRANLEQRDAFRWNSVVTNDGDICAKEGEMLVEIPSERVKIIDHEDVERTSEMVWERHG